jgi:sec-independent protein translocase protein TatB
MVSLGFWELSLIALVALLIVGPKRLPKIVRRVGFWLRRAHKYKARIKSEIDRVMDEEPKDKKDNDEKNKS